MSFEIGRLTRLPLGRVGENNARTIEINVADWLLDWPEATIGMMLQRPGEDSYYPAAVTVEAGMLRYTVKRGDVEIAGEGMAQIVLVGEGDVELRSCVAKTKVEESLPGSESGEPEDPAQPFVNKVLEAAERAEAAAERAENAGGGGGGGGTGTVTSVNGVEPDSAGNVKLDIPEPPTKLSDLSDDAEHRVVTDKEKETWNAKSNFSGNYKDLTGAPDIPDVPEWALQTKKPTYTAAEVGALPSTYTPPDQTAQQVGADPAGTASSAVGSHNTSNEAHGDIRTLIAGLTQRLNALADSDDTTLDQLSEIVAYIKSNKSLIDGITTGKVNVSDIVNNLTTNVSNKPLSAAQGVALKALIDAIVVPKKVSDLTNDKGYITGYTETDPTVPEWAKASTKPSYTKSEVGLGNVDNVKQYSASNQPPYPVTSVAGKTGEVTLGTLTFKGAASATYNGSGNIDVTIPTIAGEPGKTPVKGTDYWTPADQESIVQQVIAALGTPVFGRVDAENNIILTGELAEGEYVLKYEDAEGNLVDIGALEVGGGVTNLIPLSINADGTLYKGANGEAGYKVGYRINSSGAEAAQSGIACTGFMPVKGNETIYGSAGALTGNTGYCYIALYDSSFAFLKGYNMASQALPVIPSFSGNADGSFAFKIEQNNYIASTVVANVAYFRMSSGGIAEGNVVVTVNEPIE